MIGIWGPQARAIVASVTADDVSGEALRFRRATTISVGGAPVLAQRITYVGELGFELYVPPEWAIQVWDRLRAAGVAHGLEVCGYRSLEGLRMEKGYRYMGTDMSAGDTPYEAGVGFCVALGKGDFVGREALAAAGEPTRVLRTILLGGDQYLEVFGGEAVHTSDGVVGRVRSCAYGFTIGRDIAYTYLPAELGVGSEVMVEVFGGLVPAEVAETTLYDPGNARIRG